ncbi:hypothetical protein MRX96_021600 [Rhipicephalus microplus]
MRGEDDESSKIKQRSRDAVYLRGFFRSLTVDQGIPHGGRTRVYHLRVLQSPSETLSRMAETANRRGTSSEQLRPELTHQVHASERTRRALHTKHSAVAGLTIPPQCQCMQCKLWRL